MTRLPADALLRQALVRLDKRHLSAFTIKIVLQAHVHVHLTNIYRIQFVISKSTKLSLAHQTTNAGLVPVQV